MALPPSRLQLRTEDFPNGVVSADDVTKLFQSLGEFSDQAAACLAALTFGQNFNAEVKDITIQMPATAWSTPTYTNAWVDFSGALKGQYRVGEDGRVHGRGAIRAGVVGNGAFTLPAALWPPQDVNIGTDSNGAFGKIFVSTAGVVTPAVGSNAYFSLDDLDFEPAVVRPYVPSCFPLLVTSKVSKPKGVFLLKLYDNTNSTQIPCALGGLHWSVSEGGYTVLSLPGLVMNTKYTATLVAVGG